MKTLDYKNLSEEVLERIDGGRKSSQLLQVVKITDAELIRRPERLKPQGTLDNDTKCSPNTYDCLIDSKKFGKMVKRDKGQVGKVLESRGGNISVQHAQGISEFESVEVQEGEMVAVFSTSSQYFNDDFELMKLSIGVPREVEIIPKSVNDLIQFKFESNVFKRVVVATGLLSRELNGYYHSIRDFWGKRFVLLLNAKPKRFNDFGIESEAMLLGCEADNSVALLVLRSSVVDNGTPLTFHKSVNDRSAIIGAWLDRRFIPAVLDKSTTFKVGAPIV